VLKQIQAELEHDLGEVNQALAEREGSPEDPLVEMLSASQGDLRHALEKIATGKYGQCEACSLSIDDSRLRSLPASRICRRCELDETSNATP
jgi:DnaK suppressor protein